ncbi:MAG: fibronectin type III domain-containing protein [Deltaproteobacteria bacterium]|nr:fibronectin type III domain-containing protein [Deltaproteobacteria bacterium]
MKALFISSLMMALFLAGCSGKQGPAGTNGTNGSNGQQGAHGPAGPSMPVIQSLSVLGLPATPGGPVTATVIAQSAQGLALTYTWTVSSGWTIANGGTTPTATITAPSGYSMTGAATIEVSDTQGMYAIGMIALSTKGSGLPVLNTMSASPNPSAPGVAMQAIVSAYDPNGNSLNFTWAATAGWAITGYGATATVIAPSTYNTWGYITVTVSDNYGGAVTGTIAVGTIMVIPPSPANLTACAGNQQATLTWNISSDATSYTIYQSTASGGPYTDVASSSNPNYTVTGLINGTPYYFVVTAVNGAGESAPLNQASAVPGTLPLPPSSLYINTSSPTMCGSNYTLLLKWSESTCADSYHVYQSTSSGGPFTGIGTTTSTSFSAANLINDTNYYFVVTAADNAGESGNSNQAGLYFSVPSAPTNLQYSIDTNFCTVTLTWNASPGALSYNVYETWANFFPINFSKISNTTITNSTPGIIGGNYYNQLCFEVTALGGVFESCPSNFVCFPIPNSCAP